MVRQPFFSKKGDASPAAASLLLLLAGDVETNPGGFKDRQRAKEGQNLLTLSFS